MTAPTSFQRGFGTDEAPLALGTVRGIREWTIDRSNNLIGRRGHSWRPGVNRARCSSPRADVALNCTCGFYAYWRPPRPRRGSMIGVVEGWGKVVVGPKGFRCEKARIVALAPDSTVVGRLAAAAHWNMSLQEVEVFLRGVGQLSADLYDVPWYIDMQQMLDAHPVERPDDVPGAFEQAARAQLTRLGKLVMEP